MVNTPVTESQYDRLAREVRYFLARVIDQPPLPGVAREDLLAELSWWSAGHQRPLLDAVRRSFQVRQLCLRTADGGGTWRTSVSYIGDVDPADRAVCTYDYDRADIKFEPTSPLARPYPWAVGADRTVDAWYSRTGMAAITAWLLAVARTGAEQGRRLVLTNRLYHETGALFQAMDLTHVDLRRYDTIDELLQAAAAAEYPAVVFLDSSRPHGDAQAVSRVLTESDSGQVGCVVWDNTCAPAAQRPYAVTDGTAELDRTLLLVRSHVKLDQLALEFCPLGSITMIGGSADGPEPAAWLDALRRFIPDCLMVTGGCASPATMRTLAALGLPNHELSAPANQLLREANRLAGRLLADGLDSTGRYRIEVNEHLCFVEIHLLELPGPEDPGSSAPWAPWTELEAELTALERRAASQSIPVWKSASFGFHYTGLSWYGSDDGGGAPHTVLRLCVGQHDPEVTAAVAGMVVDQLAARRSWAVVR